MPLFALATLLPLPLLAAAIAAGGPWAWVALIYMTALTAGLDALVRRTPASAPDSEFPAGTALSVTLATLHFPLLAGSAWALGARPFGWDSVALFLAAGQYIGQVSHANAHDLIHRPTRALHRLGVAVYVSLLYGQHASAHVLVHHVHVATPRDPSSARLGEGFYAYLVRAWPATFMQGWHAESARLARAGRPAWRHPYTAYLGGAALCVALATAAGWGVLLAYILLAAYAQVQIYLSDYVQHYGLHRAPGTPVGAAHSWNSAHWFSSALLLNAPRHSDHHARPARPYPALTLPDPAPMLPRPLPVMATLALFPRRWRRVMDPRAARWQAAP